MLAERGGVSSTIGNVCSSSSSWIGGVPRMAFSESTDTLDTLPFNSGVKLRGSLPRSPLEAVDIRLNLAAVAGGIAGTAGMLAPWRVDRRRAGIRPG